MTNFRESISEKMKIAIPTDGNKGLNETVAEHFGRCKTYTFLDEIGKVIEVLDNTSRHRGGRLMPPEVIKKHGADILLCRDLGPRALNFCEQLGMDVYVCKVKTVKEIFELWKSQKIEKAGEDDICEEHRR